MKRVPNQPKLAENHQIPGRGQQARSSKCVIQSFLNYLGKSRDVMTLAHELGHGVHQVLAAGQGELLSSTPQNHQIPGRGQQARSSKCVIQSFLNYLGKSRDVMTLAHELGHGVHQVLAAGQGELLSSTPLTLAETASVFGEMLTFRRLLDQAETRATRKVLLAGKVEDMINTVVRQIAFYDFECKLHAARATGELTPDAINEIWMSVQGESLGPAFTFRDGYEVFWSYIPHFVLSRTF